MVLFQLRLLRVNLRKYFFKQDAEDELAISLHTR
jgi:hypothetical protein